MAFSGFIGPVVERELRVLSRRRRHYGLRFGYCLLLIGIVTAAWLVSMDSLTQRSAESAAAHLTARMGAVSRHVVSTVLWFQFVVANLLAVVFVSDALVEERDKGTLEVLLATPIRASEIVVGKLLARILPILTLLAITLPLLAIVRLWGGVPWSNVLSSTMITLSAVLLVGALTLMGSLWARRSHQVMVVMMVCLATLYMLSLLAHDRLGGFPAWLKQGILLVNPISMFIYAKNQQLQAQATPADQYLWLNHFLTVSVLSLGLLALVAWRLRPSVVGRRIQLWGRFRKPALRRVTGSCLLWLQLRRSVGRQLLSHAWVYLLVGAPLVVLAVQCWRTGPIGLSFRLWSVLQTELWMVLAVTTIAGSALAISRQKDQRAWPLLLTTPLTDGAIVRDLTWSVLLKNGGAWLTLFASSLLVWWVIFRRNDLSDPFTVTFQLVVALLRIPTYVMFLIGVGMYAGLRCAGGATAVMAALAILVCRYTIEKQIFWSVAYFALGAKRSGLVACQATVLGLDLLLGLLLLQRTKATLRRYCL